MPVTVTPQPTPNPNAMKYTLDRSLTTGKSKTFSSIAEAAADPLALRLFRIDGIKTVFFLNDFITITKNLSAQWEEITPNIQSALQEFFG